MQIIEYIRLPFNRGKIKCFLSFLVCSHAYYIPLFLKRLWALCPNSVTSQIKISFMSLLINITSVKNGWFLLADLAILDLIQPKFHFFVTMCGQQMMSESCQLGLAPNLVILRMFKMCEQWETFKIGEFSDIKREEIHVKEMRSAGSSKCLHQKNMNLLKFS